MKASHTHRALSPSICQHASEEEYTSFVQSYTNSERYRQDLLDARAKFVRSYPDLRDWFRVPLTERIGSSEERKLHPARQVRESCLCRYLLFLGLRGYVTFDWEWIIALPPRLRMWTMMKSLGLDQDVIRLIGEAIALGFEPSTAEKTMRWAVSRLFLHMPVPQVERICEADLNEFVKALHLFGERPDVVLFYSSAEQYFENAHYSQARLHRLHVVLYHRGQIKTEPPKKQPPVHPPTNKPRMQAVLDRYLATRRLTDQPATVGSFNTNIRRLITWLERTHPAIETFAQVTRDHILEFAEFLTTSANLITGRPVATSTRRQSLSKISVFFQDVVSWEWEDVPSHPLIKSGDLPKLPLCIPRYIPDHELDLLMPAIRTLECPYQRAALVIARWSGARREEIQRLSVDCLDSYPDGTPRLHIPAGKTKRERLVPLNQEAASAIRTLQAQHRGGRGLRDRQTGIVTQYLFMLRGKILSANYLFETPLHAICKQAGLLNADGKATVTAHRFRHTVGTQLARRGARLRTIQKVLGHESAQMSVVYIGITDEDVRNDYQAVLGSDANIAGPGAELIRSGGLAESEIRWIKEHYFQTELELGRCLRLPQEGPCECDLYLACAKFVTSPAYAPRLRRRRRIEQELVEDAAAQSWQREVERHQCTIRRLEQLLTDLGEPIEGSEAPD